MSAFLVLTTPHLRAAFLGLAATAALLAQPARAQEESSHKLRELCADDYKKYCADVTPGKGAMHTCMQANFDKLSPECRAGIEERRKNKGKS
jgi:hypothetical protein